MKYTTRKACMEEILSISSYSNTFIYHSDIGKADMFYPHGTVPDVEDFYEYYTIEKDVTSFGHEFYSYSVSSDGDKIRGLIAGFAPTKERCVDWAGDRVANPNAYDKNDWSWMALLAIAMVPVVLAIYKLVG